MGGELNVVHAELVNGTVLPTLTGTTMVDMQNIHFWFWGGGEIMTINIIVVVVVVVIGGGGGNGRFENVM